MSRVSLEIDLLRESREPRQKFITKGLFCGCKITVRWIVRSMLPLQNL